MKVDKEKNTRGYLKEDFQLFHIKDKKNMEFDFHYHDFNKIIVFISGKVTYLIEGKAYKLKPWDILLISSSEVHKPIIDSSEPYERMVIWVNSNFLKKHNEDNCNLLTLFEIACEKNFNLVRVSNELKPSLKELLFLLQESKRSNLFGSKILSNSIFIQLIVHLNRTVLNESIQKENDDIEYDETINKVLSYINNNLTKDLSIEAIASKFYINKYYLMHKFKKSTGYTLHNYVLQKRLLLSKNFILEGIPITEVYLDCGFNDYSNFLRAFKKKFGSSPRLYYKNKIEDN